MNAIHEVAGISNVRYLGARRINIKWDRRAQVAYLRRNSRGRSLKALGWEIPHGTCSLRREIEQPIVRAFFCHDFGQAKVRNTNLTIVNQNVALSNEEKKKAENKNEEILLG